MFLNGTTAQIGWFRCYCVCVYIYKKKKKIYTVKVVCKQNCLKIWQDKKLGYGGDKILIYIYIYMNEAWVQVGSAQNCTLDTISAVKFLELDSIL